MLSESKKSCMLENKQFYAKKCEQLQEKVNISKLWAFGNLTPPPSKKKNYSKMIMFISQGQIFLPIIKYCPFINIIDFRQLKLHEHVHKHWILLINDNIGMVLCCICHICITLYGNITQVTLILCN